MKMELDQEGLNELWLPNKLSEALQRIWEDDFEEYSIIWGE